MVRSILISVTAVALASPALAAPADYLDVLPERVHDMEQVEAEMVGDELVAYYGETVGRATLRIFAAPDADMLGASAQDPASTGETPSAQRALLDLLSRNLAEGAVPLGDGYATGPVRLSQIEIDGGSTIDGTIINCGSIDRTAAGGAEASGDVMGLVDNVCVSQHGADIIAVSITTPVSSEAMRQQFFQMQISFAGQLIGGLLND